MNYLNKTFFRFLFGFLMVIAFSASLTYFVKNFENNSEYIGQ